MVAVVSVDHRQMVVAEAPRFGNDGEVTKKAKKHSWLGGDVNGNRPTWLEDAPPFLEGLLRIIQVCKKTCGHYSINGLVSESRQVLSISLHDDDSRVLGGACSQGIVTDVRRIVGVEVCSGIPSMLPYSGSDLENNWCLRVPKWPIHEFMSEPRKPADEAGVHDFLVVPCEVRIGGVG